MKKIITFILLSILFYACDSKEERCKVNCYPVQYQTPEDREKQAAFIISVVKAATEHLTTGDYEDVDDTIAEAKRQSKDLFYHTRIKCVDCNWQEVTSNNEGNND